jgi:ABC-type uncharacterized transport system fused permease/ATPase subunit
MFKHRPSLVCLEHGVYFGTDFRNMSTKVKSRVKMYSQILHITAPLNRLRSLNNLWEASRRNSKSPKSPYWPTQSSRNEEDRSFISKENKRWEKIEPWGMNWDEA